MRALSAATYVAGETPWNLTRSNVEPDADPTSAKMPADVVVENVTPLPLKWERFVRVRADANRIVAPGGKMNVAPTGAAAVSSSQYASADFDAAFGEFQAAIGVDAQKAACKKIETILNEDVAVALPYWYNYLAGSSKAYEGIYSSALGQMFFSSTAKIA